MMPIGYTLPDHVLENLPELLKKNNISVLKCLEDESYNSLEGERALTISRNIVESSFVLPEPEDIILHAILMCSGAQHFGSKALELWPHNFLIKVGGITDSSILQEELGQQPVQGDIGSNSGVIKVCGLDIIFAVRMSPERKLESIIVPERKPNAMHLERWRIIKQNLLLKGYVEEERGIASSENLPDNKTPTTDYPPPTLHKSE